MTQLRNQGMVLGEDHEKMSKSRGNVTAPDVLVEKYGADTVRAYLMFFARWEMGDHGIVKESKAQSAGYGGLEFVIGETTQGKATQVF